MSAATEQAMEAMLPDLRRRRADVIAHNILHALEPWIERLERLDEWRSAETPEGEPRFSPPKNRRDIYRAVFDLLYAQGMEVIADSDRAEAGLDWRNHKGLTNRELMILEERRLEVMRRPIFAEAMPPKSPP